MIQRAALLNRFIITGGPTREWLDPVRYISNASSGKMGIALARAAIETGGEVLFIHGPLSVPTHDLRCAAIAVETAEEMCGAVIASLKPHAILVMAAAPADYRPARKEERKIKKGSDTLTLECVKNPDILKAVHEKRMSQEIPLFVAGFAAETHDAERYAQAKLEDKGLDAICVNDLSSPGSGFNVETNEITILFADGSRIKTGLVLKSAAAKMIIDSILEKVNF